MKTYRHRGFWKSLKSLAHHYPTCDIPPTCEDIAVCKATEARALDTYRWPKPEVSVNLNTDQLCNLGLTEEEEDALVAFKQAMSDGYLAKDNDD